MVKFVTMAKVLVLFIYLHMKLFYEASCRLKYFCTMIKAEYALSFILELCLSIGAIHIEASVIHYQQCNKYPRVINVLTNHLQFIFWYVQMQDFTLGCFKIVHISRHDNSKELAQQASGCYVNHGVLHFYQQPMLGLVKAKSKPTASATNETFMQAK